MWRGEQVLPVGWVAYSTTPTGAFSGYGAGWWLGYPGDPPASYPADGPHLPSLSASHGLSGPAQILATRALTHQHGMLHVSAGNLLYTCVLAILIATHHVSTQCPGAAAGAPNGTFYGNGLLGQRVIVVPSQDLVIARMGLNFLNDFDPVPAPPPLACRSLHEYVRSADDEALMSQTCICLCSHSCELDSAPVCCPAHTSTPCMFTRERQQVTWRGYQ